MADRFNTEGITIGRGDGSSPESYTDIPQVTSISGPDGSATEIDVSDLSSTEREFQLGLKDEGSVSLELVWDENDAEHAGLRTDRSGGTLRNFRITLDDGSPNTTIDFSAYVMGLSMNFGVDEVQRATVNLRISGGLTVS